MTLFDYDAKVEKREQLQEDMNAAGFWDSQTAAQKVIDKYKVLKAQTSDLEDVISVMMDSFVGYELAKDTGDADLLTEGNGQLFKMQRHIDKIETQSSLIGQEDYSKLFVSTKS